MYTKLLTFCGLIWCSISLYAQVFTGKVESATGPLADVQVELFNYSQSIQNSQTNSAGQFSIAFEKNQEYIACFSKKGYISQTISLHLPGNHNETIVLSKDPNSPNGMLSPLIQYRIQYAPIAKKNTKSTFDYSNIASSKKADSIKVIFNKVQIYQYRYISDAMYDSEKEEITKLNYEALLTQKAIIGNDLLSTRTAIRKSKEISKELMNQEKKYIEETKTKQGNAQLKRIVDAQEAQYKRIYENGQQYLLQKNESILLYKLKMIEYYSLLNQEANAKDFGTALANKKLRLNAQSQAYNYLYQANNYFSKYEAHLTYYQNAYQEYIELLKYYQTQTDSSATLSPIIVSKSKSNIEGAYNIPFVAKNDSIATMPDQARQAYIEKALEEEERFKNYSSIESIRKIDGEENRVTTIKIDTDIYEYLITPKGITKYYKNSKPISAATFKFETTRKYKNILDNVK